MTHACPSSDVSGLQISAPGQPHLRAGSGRQAIALSPRPADHAPEIARLHERINALEQRLAEIEGRGLIPPVQGSDPVAIADRAQRLLAARFRLQVGDLVGRSRASALILPRFIAIYLTRKFAKLTLHQIGALYNRDHGTIMHALQSLSRWTETDSATRALVADIERQFAALLT